MQKTEIKNIIWDMDGVLFPYDHSCIQALIQSTAKAVTLLKPATALDTALELAEKSQNELKNCFTLFTRDHGFDFDILAKHSFACVDLDQMIIPNPKQTRAIRAFGPNQAILTRANMDWALRLVTHLGLQDIFNENNIIACDNNPEMDKAKSTAPFLHTLSHTGFSAHETAMVEDNPNNLQFAKQAGLITVLLHTAPVSQKQAFVDYQFIDTVQLLDTITLPCR